MANVPLQLNEANRDAILARVEAADFSNVNFDDQKTFVSANRLFEVNRTEADNFFNLFSLRNFDATLTIHADVEADGYTDAHIAEASSILYRKLSAMFGRAGAGFIIQRVPIRIYMNGIHSSSNKSTQLGRYDQATFGNLEEIIARLIAAGISQEVSAELAEKMIRYIPYEAFTLAVNSLNSKISKRMILRMMAIKMKVIHDGNANDTLKNVFKASIDKYGLDISNADFPEEWLFFGADFHPLFPNDQRKTYKDIQTDIFEAAKGEAGQPAPFRPL